MSRLIDADEILQYLEKQRTFAVVDCKRNNAYGKGMRDAMKIIKEAPTIEAEPVRHGHWINVWDENDPNISTFGRCSKCDEKSKRPLGRYCRWCGAHMDEVSE